jgi:alcohol dehydrogenase (cytochrome c)
VFSGDQEGYLYAFESTTGKLLWRFQTGGAVWGIAPISYMLDGRQWIVVPSGVTVTAFTLPGSGSRSRP